MTLSNGCILEVKRVILSVEDDNTVYVLIRSALDDLASEFQLEHSVDGEDALNFLKQRGNFSNALKPSLILLDINLPRVSGPELLAVIQSDKLLWDIPVVMFSTSRLDSDRARCLALGARQFITKPDDYSAFVNAIKCACDYASSAGRRDSHKCEL
jgi:CheY-like chemotaxis protein